MVRLDFVYPLRVKGGFSRGEFRKAVGTPDGIVRMVPGVWLPGNSSVSFISGIFPLYKLTLV